MNGKAADFLKSRRIPASNLRGTVAHVNLPAVVRESPAFAGILETPDQLESVSVVDETPMGLPSQLNDALIQQRNAFAEVFGVQPDLLKDFSGLQVHFAQTRPSVQPRSLIQKTAAIFQPLREGGAVMCG